MITIEKLRGLEKRLYELVAPLVMNPDVLKQNRNYPFKTSQKFWWFVAVEENKTVGFLPVEIRDEQAIINNYYTIDENQDILDQLVKEAVCHFRKEKKTLFSVTQNQHIPTLINNGFIIEREWKNYVKMRRIE